MASPMENGGSIVSCRGSFGRLPGLRDHFYKAFRRQKSEGKRGKGQGLLAPSRFLGFAIYYCRPSAAAMTILHAESPKQKSFVCIVAQILLGRNRRPPSLGLLQLFRRLQRWPFFACTWCKPRLLHCKRAIATKVHSLGPNMTKVTQNGRIWWIWKRWRRRGGGGAEEATMKDKLGNCFNMRHVWTLEGFYLFIAKLNLVFPKGSKTKVCGSGGGARVAWAVTV